MKMKKKRRRKLLGSVLTGFTVLYILTMLLATRMVKGQFASDYEEALDGTLLDMQRNIYEVEQNPPDTWGDTAKFAWYQSLVNTLLQEGDPFHALSVAVYDEQGRLLAKSANTIGTTMASLDEILSQEDKETLAGYVAERGKKGQNFHPPAYDIQIRETDEIHEILVYELTWKKEEDMGPDESYTVSHQTTSRTDSFGNSDYETGDETITWYNTDRRQIWKCTVTTPDESLPSSIHGASASFPYISTGYKAWKAWDESTFLHDFPTQLDPSTVGESFSGGSIGSWMVYDFTSAHSSAEPAPDAWRFVEVRMESRPWLAAMDYMKYVYLAGFAIMLAAMIQILFSASKIYNQQEALEESRRDFINAMAHELKTPLGVIRNFTENLQEGHRQEKRDYYLEQILGQTEEMDRLVEEMILVSKIDSEKLALPQETLSMEDLIREQLSRLEPLIAEKNLRVDIQSQSAFLVEGDKDYLAKALWSLLSNAVVYNQQEGMLRIFIEANACRIENTGGPLTEEQLTHAFDLFYSRDKSRSSTGEKHLGAGLYLAKKILGQHGLSLTLENSALGVRAEVATVSLHRR